jgi:hypothetical protein
MNVVKKINDGNKKQGTKAAGCRANISTDPVLQENIDAGKQRCACPFILQLCPSRCALPANGTERRATFRCCSHHAHAQATAHAPARRRNVNAATATRVHARQRPPAGGGARVAVLSRRFYARAVVGPAASTSGGWVWKTTAALIIYW